MKQCFVPKNFSADSLKKIEIVNIILDEYAAQGFDLTLRQLYYQMVARGYIENTMQSYKRTGSLVSDARLAGLIDWSMIADRGRETVTPNHWRSPAEIVESAARQFRIDKWETQRNHVEVMVEKQALEGVLIPVCRKLDIPFSANKGYSSSSAMYETGQRLFLQHTAGKTVWLLYLGDHDPSGIDMTRDVGERLEMFADVPVYVKRLALNYDQVETLHPPENPAKDTDSRYAGYVEQFGESSWELDAVSPTMLAQLVTDAVLPLRDETLWAEAVLKENRMREDLQEFADTYEEPED